MSLGLGEGATRGATGEAAGGATELLDVSALELAARIRRGELTSAQVVERHIARIAAVNPLLNAMVRDRFAAAREEAREADARLRAHPTGDHPPLLGVPCTIKDVLAVRGMPQTGGIWHRRDHVPAEDSTVVARVRAAGAIVLGITNAPEGGLWMETNNTIYGRTHNPWDLRRTSGGSSGGEGALVAAGASPFGLGSDIGGSIRIPAAFCGVVGHKPTGRMVPNTGQWPSVEGEAASMLCIGPLARRVGDVMPLLRILAGPDGVDPHCAPFELGSPDDVDLGRLTVIPVEHNHRIRVRASMRGAVQSAARALADAGASVREQTFPALRRSLEIWATVLSEGASGGYDEVLGDGRPIAVWRELAKALVGRSVHTRSALIVAAAEKVIDRIPVPRARYVALARQLGDEIHEALGERGVLIVPPYSRPAPRHRDAWRTPFDAMYTAVFNALELPVTVVPVGFDHRGLPLAVQVVASRGCDHVAIAAAQAIEDRLGGWVRATPRSR